MTLRVAVIGSDVGARAFVAFLKQRVPTASITCFATGDTQPDRGVTFSSPWIRNDKKGRLTVLRLGREILGIGDQEFCVSKVNIQLKLRDSEGKISRIPSFVSVLKNIFALGLEPFRPRTKPSEDISVSEFMRLRFGHSFAKRYSDVISAPFAAEKVSVHAFFPKLAQNFFRFNSVMVGPLWAIADRLSGASSFKNVDVMDHLWQELVSGGKYVSMLPRLDFSLFHQLLESHVASVSTACSLCDFQLERFDLVVSSQRPDELVSQFDRSHKQDWAAALSEHEKALCTRLVSASASPSADGEIIFSSPSTDEGICGIIVQSGLYEHAPAAGVVVDVFSTKPVDIESVRRLYPAADGLEVSSSYVEELPSCKLGWTKRMIDFNRWRLGLKKSLNIDLQVVGKWYYCPSGSLTDLVGDASELADIIADRYQRFPKRVENEQSNHWMSRNDRSLDFSYSTDRFSAPKL